MDQRTFDVGRCFSDGFAAFRANPGPAILGFIVFGLVSLVLQYIPFVNFIATIFLFAPLQGGLSILQINLIRGRNPSPADIFGGFNHYGKFMGVYWLLAAISIASMLVAMIPVIVASLPMLPASGSLDAGALSPSSISANRANIPLIIGLATVGFLTITIIMFRWIFVYFVIADEPDRHSIVAAFKRSAEITAGNRLGI